MSESVFPLKDWKKPTMRSRGTRIGFLSRGYKTLKELRKMGMKDVGFGMTVQDKNAKRPGTALPFIRQDGNGICNCIPSQQFLFCGSKKYYPRQTYGCKEFRKTCQRITEFQFTEKVVPCVFNHGLINYIYGQKRLLPCDMSFDTFFIDPYGDVMPCNGTKDKEVMGNLNEQTWEELWNSAQAEEVRKKVRCCDRDCWMIGSVSPAMHKYIWVPAWWVIRHKLKFWTKKKYSMYENKIVREYRDGKVSKEELDKCSTCDMNCTINDGLSKESRHS